MSKLATILFCLSISLSTIAQEPYVTMGKFVFVKQIQFSDTVQITPGQLNKTGDTFYLGLQIERDTGFHCDIYKLKPDGKTTAIGLAGYISYRELMQPTVTADETQIIVTVNNFKGWGGNDLMECVFDNAGVPEKIRLMSELNTPDISEAYPWISADGLRIYFTRNDKIYSSTRSNRNAIFQEPALLEFDGISNLNVLSCWLTRDEKNLFIVSDNIIYMAKRKSVKKKFNLPQIYTNEFKDFSFISGISFTPDLKELYLYHSDDSASILHYRRE